LINRLLSGLRLRINDSPSLIPQCFIQLSRLGNPISSCPAPLKGREGASYLGNSAIAIVSRSALQNTVAFFFNLFPVASFLLGSPTI
jgi:hypothetical protein